MFSFISFIDVMESAIKYSTDDVYRQAYLATNLYTVQYIMYVYYTVKYLMSFVNIYMAA